MTSLDTEDRPLSNDERLELVDLEMEVAALLYQQGRFFEAFEYVDRAAERIKGMQP